MPENTGILSIAHRGFRAVAPENTLAAARAGLAAGADWWELDVAASADGELVVIHDDTLVRTTDAERRFPRRSPWSVYGFTMAELATLDAGSWYGETDPFGQVAAGAVGADALRSFRGEPLPTLRAALLLTRDAGWKVNVEIKDATGQACDAWIVERTVELVRGLGMLDSVLVSSFNHDYLRRVRAAEPRLAIGALVERDVPDPVGLLRSLGAEAYHPWIKYLREETVRSLRAAGLAVNVWTVNDEADMRRLIEWGVTGIITDFPDRLARVLGRDGG